MRRVKDKDICRYCGGVMREKLYLPMCIGCPHDLHCLDFVPRKQYGVMMRCGEHYCTGGKRVRRFKKRDPQSRAPDWCPKRKHPCGLRVYALKSTEGWFLHSMLEQNIGKGFGPSAHRYALRFEGTIQQTPQEFWKRCDQEPAAGLLPIPIQLYEVLEIDDGLKPACFYWKDGAFTLLWSFDAATARKNVLQQDEDNTDYR